MNSSYDLQQTFDTVQQQLDSRRTTDWQERTRRDDLPFRQKIVCPRCGRFLTTYQVNRKHRNGADSSTGTTVAAPPQVAGLDAKG